MDGSSPQRRSSERRRLWDRRSPQLRRSGLEQRTGERRASDRSPDSERRARSDRRKTDRRTAADRRGVVDRRREPRRRETPRPYTAEQFAELVERFASQGPVSCPACGSRVALDPAQRSGTERARGVLCFGCGRAAVVPHVWAARVLVVAQNRLLRNLLRDMLDGAGHDVVEADDTGVALAAYRTAPADVIIIDVAAPGRVPAPEFQRQLRTTFPDVRIVALAGRSTYAGVDPLTVVSGMEGVRSIRVPVSREELLKTVQEARA